jgi:hypothetical protein
MFTIVVISFHGLFSNIPASIHTSSIAPSKNSTTSVITPPPSPARANRLWPDQTAPHCHFVETG